jgi:hypothetical protein
MLMGDRAVNSSGSPRSSSKAQLPRDQSIAIDVASTSHNGNGQKNCAKNSYLRRHLELHLEPGGEIHVLH